MALSIHLSGILGVEAKARRIGADEVLSVLPRTEASSRFPWPSFDIPHHVVEVTDFGCGKLWPQDVIDDIMATDGRSERMIPPSLEIVQRIIEVGAGALERARYVADSIGHDADHTLLIHCHAGASRSVAAAFIILALEDGPGREEDSWERLCRIYGKGSCPSPNANLVLLADQALDRDGRLFGVYERKRTEELAGMKDLDPNDFL